MANEEQMSILKQGSIVWNRWRKENKTADVNLIGADLILADLTDANLSHANLSQIECFQADLSGADLTDADLAHASFVDATLADANLAGADARAANFTKADLIDANLVGTNLAEANFHEALATGANLTLANLVGAKLRSTALLKANLDQAMLTEADLSEARLGSTILTHVNLSNTLNLDEVLHLAPSPISFDTIQLSLGKIDERFLRGCGLSDVDIEYAKLADPGLSNEEINKTLYRIYDLRATQALQISPLFISYSHADSVFVDKLERQLSVKGIRFWRDIHEMKAGRIETQIDKALSQKPTVLLILSEHSLTSDWVEHEVRLARGVEKEIGRDVLCPVALDDSWKSSRWPKRVMEQIMEYNILDFSAWKDDSRFDGMFRKLIDGLELFYKG